MSWPIVRPPWKHVKWLSWGDPEVYRWTYPPFPVWSIIPSSTDMSGELHGLKQTIEELDSKGEWEYLKRSSNPYELVFSQSQDIRIPPSISILRPLSRSFFKMIEILNVMNFFKRHQYDGRKSIIRSAHVCEGPGGFIEALIHSAGKSGFIVEHSWAMTLKPTKTNIPGWKRAFHFLRKNPSIHIEYGSDDTGDILVAENQTAFLEKAGSKCNIFTADGGFDFSEHYSTQEDEVFPLLISSVIIGLQTLVKGGDFVLKVFDTENESTRDLLALLAYCFDNWTLYKPALSRPCNAEKYFLGKGCRFVPYWIINTLTQIRDTYSTANGSHIMGIFHNIPSHVEKDIELLKKEYLDQQIAALNYAISNNVEWNENPVKIWNEIYKNSSEWCNEFQVPMKLVSKV